MHCHFIKTYITFMFAYKGSYAGKRSVCITLCWQRVSHLLPCIVESADHQSNHVCALIMEFTISSGKRALVSDNDQSIIRYGSRDTCHV